MLPQDVAEELWLRGVRAHPGVAGDRTEFLAQVERTNVEAPPQGWSSLHAEDVFLAAACVRGDSVALARFDQVMSSAVRGTLLRVCGSTAAADEARQQVRERLLLPRSGQPARLAEFGGRSALGVWLRAVATRVALDARAKKPEGDDEVLELVLDSGDDPELKAMKAPIREAFHGAFREAFAGLTERERAVLRSHYLDGLTTEQLGRVYGVHKITVTRWLVAARKSLLAAMREKLRKQLRVDGSELDSLLRVARSQLGRSLSGLSG